MNRVNVPQLRFPGFEGTWKIEKLKDISKIERGRFSPRPRNNPIYYNGEIPFVQTSDVVNANGKIEFYTQTLNEKGLAVSKLFPKGSILITIAANIGHSGVLQIDMACPDSLIGIKPNKNINNYYLNYYLSTHQKKMDYLAPEGAQKNINIEFLNPYKVPTTTLAEQQKIASFLSAVDERIQQLSRKKELLEQYKKGIMQQLFSGKLRFKDENGNDYADWEEKKLGDVCEIGSGKDYKHLEKGNIPVFGTGGYMLSVNKYLHSGETVFIGRKGTIDKPFYFKGEFWTVDTLFYTHTFKNVIPKFIYCVFQQVNWKLHNEASGVPSLSKSTIEKLKFDFPSIEEQQKIADFLSSIDAKIESTNEHITQTQSFKKGLLQQMFI
jgi:type I restriction enzyme S subunit